MVGDRVGNVVDDVMGDVFDGIGDGVVGNGLDFRGDVMGSALESASVMSGTASRETVLAKSAMVSWIIALGALGTVWWAMSWHC